MTHHAVYYDSDGRLTRSIELEDGWEIPTFAGEDYLLSDVFIDLNSHYTDGETFVSLGDAPDLYYEFDYTTKEWVYNETLEADAVRAKRNFLLLKSDWTHLSDAPLTLSERLAWAAYRADLRAVPDQTSFPSEVTWPTPPS